MIRLERLLSSIKEQGIAETGITAIYLYSGSKPYVKTGPGLLRLEGIEETRAKDVEEFLRHIFDSTKIKRPENLTEIILVYESKGLGRFRMVITRGKRGYNLSLKPLSTTLPSFDSLSLPDVVRRFAFLNKGLVLIIGKSGSGKTATLAALVNHINAMDERNIVSLEDPPEYYYGDGLSHVRQPLIGSEGICDSVVKENQTRGAEVVVLDGLPLFTTVKTALSEAAKGLLVFASINSNGGVPEVLRIIVNIYPQEARQDVRAILAANLNGALWQHILPRKDGGGVVTVYEILLKDQVISSLIRTDMMHLLRSAMAAGRPKGMQTMNQALEALRDEDTVSTKDIEACRREFYSYYIHPLKEEYY